MHIHTDKGGQVLLTNVKPSGNFDNFTKKLRTTYYVDKSKRSESKQKQAESNSQNYSYGTSSSSASYANSAFAALR